MTRTLTILFAFFAIAFVVGATGAPGPAFAAAVEWASQQGFLTAVPNADLMVGAVVG